MEKHSFPTIRRQAESLLLCALLAIVFGCKDDSPVQPTDNPPVPTPPETTSRIELAYSYLDLTYEATEEEVRFEATDDWEIKSLPEWVSATPTDGGEGTDICLTLSIEENPEYRERTGDVILATADGQDADTLTVRQFGISAYIPIDYEENKLTGFDPATGTVTLEYGDQKPTLRAGASIVIPTDSISYIRIVQQVSQDGNTLTLQTEEGDMTDVFVNQEFTLATTPVSRAVVTRGGGVRTTDERGVIHPVKITASMPDGSMRTLYDLEAQAATRATGDIINAGDDHPFFDRTYSADGETIADWGNARLEWEKCNHRLSVSGHFNFTFGMRTEVSDDGTVSVPKGELLGFWCYVEGAASAEMIMKLIAESEFDAGLNEDVLEDVLTARGFTFTFPVAGVPVTVNVNADIMVDAAIAADANAELTAGMSAGMDINAGFSYVYGSRSLEPIWTAPDPTFTLHKPELTAKANVDAHVSLYPKIRVRFFNFAGPDIAIKPYLLDHLEFDGRAGMEGENHAKWSNRLYYRTDLEANLALDFAGIPGWDWSSATMTISTPEQDLHRTPDKIELVSPENGSLQPESQPITVKFSVTDFSITGDNEASAEAAVQFIPSQGIVDASLGYSDENGEVTVQWTPDPETRANIHTKADMAKSLEAQVMGKDDRVISTTTFAPDFNRDREILEAFYRSADGDNWSRHDNWCTDKPLNEWYGVNAIYNPETGEERVFGINLYEVTGINGTADFRGLSQVNNITLGAVDENKHKHVTSVNVAGLSNLVSLNLRNCELASLNVSGCNNLRQLMLYDNNLTEIDLSGCPNLKTLACSNNKLEHVDFSHIPNIKFIAIDENPCADVDVSMLDNLVSFIFGSENMTKAPTMSVKNQSITDLDCREVKFESIDLSILHNLEALTIGNAAIQSLDLSANTKLQELTLFNTQIESLNVSDLSELTFLSIRDNEKLTSAIATNLAKLETARCWWNPALTSLEISNCPLIKEIETSYNEGLVSLNTANCANLEELISLNNDIRNLNVSYCPNLKQLFWHDKNLETVNIVGSTKAVNLFHDCQIISVTVSAADYGSVNCPGWGKHDDDVYQPPTYKSGWQYPQYIIVP